ncbi:MAG: TIGR00282 family metallophosphoesterase [Kiritimatiellae bacterium]|nr:TIGR00282 family metallophosphoesterase [Kiritimatiellia bacterium]
MKILIVGDIVGSPGRRIFKNVVKRMRAENAVHAVVANAENAAAGSGITGEIAAEIFAAGADVITLGDHAWNQKGIEAAISGERRLLRPANFPEGCPGHGWITVQTAVGPLTVVNLLGRVFLPPLDCPFRCMDALLKRIPADAPILVDFHAEATSEKIAMGWYLDGRVAAVVGSHTHVQTSDERILPKGTAYLTDLGMTGPSESVIGREIEPVLKKFVTGMPSRFDVAKGPAVLEGLLLELNRATGKASALTRVRERDTPDVAAAP